MITSTHSHISQHNARPVGRRTLSREQRLVSFEKGRRKKDKWCHPKAWTHSGATYEAFSQVGMVMRKDARETRRQLDAVAALSLALRKHSGEACRAWAMMHPFQQKVTKWVLLEDEIDCTPIKTWFGQLREALAPTARYWWRAHREAQWKLLSAEDMKQRNKQMLPNKGVVELFAHFQRLTFPKCVAKPFPKPDEDPWLISIESKTLRAPACFLARSNASTMFAAVNSEHTHFGFDRLCKLADQGVEIVIWNVGSDLAASCFRLKFKIAELAMEHNSKARREHVKFIIIVVDTQCVGHIMDTESRHQFQKALLCPKLFNTAWSSCLPGSYSALATCLLSILQEDLATGFFPHVRPPVDVGREHTLVLIKMTLSRSCAVVSPQSKCFLYYCAHLRPHFVCTPLSHPTSCSVATRSFSRGEHDDLEEGTLLQECEALLNGNTRGGGVQHYCYLPGCCGGQNLEVCIQRMCTLFDELVFKALFTFHMMSLTTSTSSPSHAFVRTHILAHRHACQYFARPWARKCHRPAEWQHLTLKFAGKVSVSLSTEFCHVCRKRLTLTMAVTVTSMTGIMMQTKKTDGCRSLSGREGNVKGSRECPPDFWTSQCVQPSFATTGSSWRLHSRPRRPSTHEFPVAVSELLLGNHEPMAR